MANEIVSALVLPAERAGSVEPQAVAGIPGRWEPDVGYAPEALGLTLGEAKKLIEERGLPLEIRSLPADEVRSEFSRASGSHIPSSLARPELPRAQDSARVAEPFVNSQGVPLDAGQLPAPKDTPAWVQQELDRATALSNGDGGSTEASMSPEIQGVRVQESPSLDLPSEVAAQLVETEGSRALKKLKKAELVEQAKEAGLNHEGTAADLAAGMTAHAVRCDHDQAVAAVRMRDAILVHFARTLPALLEDREQH